MDGIVYLTEPEKGVAVAAYPERWTYDQAYRHALQDVIHLEEVPFYNGSLPVMRNADKYLKEMYGSNCMDVQINKCARGKGDVYLKRGGEASRCTYALYAGGFDYPYKVRVPWIRAGELAPLGSTKGDAGAQSVAERRRSQASTLPGVGILALQRLGYHVLADVCARDLDSLVRNQTSSSNAERSLGDCLVANRWRTQQEVDNMDILSRRNTVIVELAKPAMQRRVIQRLKALGSAASKTAGVAAAKKAAAEAKAAAVAKKDAEETAEAGPKDAADTTKKLANKKLAGTAASPRPIPASRSTRNPRSGASPPVAKKAAVGEVAAAALPKKVAKLETAAAVAARKVKAAAAAGDDDANKIAEKEANAKVADCLLYTSDAADEEDSVDLGGRRIIKKKKRKRKRWMWNE
eukprot:TRINITY_DN5736_c0_g1_i2.p1 TRINITY_DN5736_c0_g1~~TRINITY_DN5736_c0_g1_i2.p1  ORF type:complete len:407 (-),score=97.98 TRINITY_DN5736_c0_g1_i2:77-1297(-)